MGRRERQEKRRRSSAGVEAGHVRARATWEKRLLSCPFRVQDIPATFCIAARRAEGAAGLLFIAQ